MSSATDHTGQARHHDDSAETVSISRPLTEDEKRLIEVIQRNTQMAVWADGNVMIGKARVGP